MRAVSTVLDATLCLLLVTASALTLAGTPAKPTTNPGPDAADQTAAMLATSTAQVTYRVGDDRRTAHDTLAGLLASAVVRDDQPIRSTNFTRAVTAMASRALRRRDVDVQVIAREKADLDSTDSERVVAGTPPPPHTDVHAAAFAVRNVTLTVRVWSS